MSMVSQFEQQLIQIIPSSPNLLVALSGGVDSVVLLHLLTQIKYKGKVRAIHIHHGLSVYADDWSAFCQGYCKKLSVPFIAKKVSLTTSGNLESQARKARYQAIEKHLQLGEVLVTAHHLNDQAETFLLALKRGSGVKGLGAMKLVSNLHNHLLVRPLLTFSKEELTDYAIKNQLNWVEDESNVNTHFDRNFLRNDILPLLNQRWPHFSAMVSRSAEHCAKQQQLLDELLYNELKQHSDFDRKSLNVSDFPKYSDQKQKSLLRLWLAQHQILMPERQQLIELQRLITAKPDKNPHLELKGNIIRRYHTAIFITPKWEETLPFCAELTCEQNIKLPHELGQIIRHQTKLIYQSPTQVTQLFLPELLGNKTVELKLHCRGKVKVYGRTQHEEMKKIWQQNQVPVWLRTRTPVVFFKNQFVALLI